MLNTTQFKQVALEAVQKADVFSNLKLEGEKIVPTFQNGFEVVALRAKTQDVQALVNYVGNYYFSNSSFL